MGVGSPSWLARKVEEARCIHVQAPRRPRIQTPRHPQSPPLFPHQLQLRVHSGLCDTCTGGRTPWPHAPPGSQSTRLAGAPRAGRQRHEGVQGRGRRAGLAGTRISHVQCDERQGNHRSDGGGQDGGREIHSHTGSSCGYMHRRPYSMAACAARLTAVSWGGHPDGGWGPRVGLLPELPSLFNQDLSDIASRRCPLYHPFLLCDVSDHFFAYITAAKLLQYAF